MVAVALAVCAVAGCGTSESDQVQAKVQQFAQAVATHDSQTLCDQIWAPALLAHFTAVGLSCERAMQTFFASVRDPTLAVGRVEISGNKAEAITLSGARHQVGALDAIDLVDTSNGWRVSGLGSPLLPKSSKRK
jgi:hypothetical protein